MALWTPACLGCSDSALGEGVRGEGRGEKGGGRGTHLM